ncbi:MAG TPA: DUF4249 domain-containing protein [Puia sp.]|jgi:hypothetical protein|nr:DUF4249 domain-containing protein [Puia sp.]
MRPRLIHIGFCFLLLITGSIRCKQAFEPPAIEAPNRYLVVDGFINIGTGTVTAISLNRTRNLGADTTAGFPELNARAAIVGSQGATYSLTDIAGTGIYTSAPLTLDTTQQYRIIITTSDGRKYASDPVPCKPTPPIDSLFWRQPDDFTVYVNTHDPTGKTRYYRYDYSETWEHDAEVTADYSVAGGMIVPVDSSNQKFRCWTTAPSTNVSLATSTRLAQDIINAFPITTIFNGDTKMTIAYSILVRQYALTEDAYNYWLLIQKTTDALGTLFDLQPTQLMGNIHCITDPSEPVIGFLSASTVQQQRIFVYHSNLNSWKDEQLIYGCDSLSIPVNPMNPLIYNYPDTFYAPWYFEPPGYLVLGSRFCIDCTLFGGINQRPSYWPF